MKPLLLLPVFLLLLTSNIRAQNQVSGKVQDATGKALGFSNALLLDASDSSLVRGMIVSDQGNFTFEKVTSGTFLVVCAMIGYDQQYSAPFDLIGSDSKKVLDPIRLKESNASLREVQIVARRPFLEQKIDRTVVNVANSITNAGGTALEVLQRSPGVQVNSLTNSISLLGKEGVVVMINGKISRLPSDAIVQMLAGMNSDNIDHIELIHTPPANFEAEGNAGIINIVLKSTGDEGLNGGYSAKAGYGKAEKYGAGIYFNYRKNKVNWYGNYDYNFNLNPQVFTNYRGVQQGNDFLETESYSDRPLTPLSVQNARLGLDYQISKKTVIGVLGTFFDRYWYMEAVNDVTYSKNGALASRLRMPNTETNHNQSFAGNINVTHQFSQNQSLSIDADVINFSMHNPSHYAIQNLDAFGDIIPQYELRISKKTPIRVAVAKADYSINFGTGLKLESGAKATSVRFENDVQVDSLPPQQDWIILQDLSSLAMLNEQLFGIYTTFSAKINDKTDLKAGIRYENTNTNLGSIQQPNLVDRHYGSWFPSVFVTRKLAETQSLNISYSRRITRPKIRELAPWLIFSDPTTVEGGNPALQPSFTDALRLNYIIKTWQFGVSYSLENNPIRFVPAVDPATNRQINRDENLDNEKVASAYLAIPIHPTKWWEGQNNLFVNSTTINFELEGKKTQLSNINYGFSSTQTFTFPKKISLEIAGNYNSPGYWGVAEWRATGSVVIGIQKDFGEHWGKLRFNASNLFVSDNWFGTTSQPEINLLVKNSYQFAERVFMLSWTNTFGSKKLKSSRSRETGSAEEMNRI